MSISQERERVRKSRHHRIRRRISGTAERPRLVVHRSLRNITAQMVDDATGRTLLGVTSTGIGAEGTKIEQSRQTGLKLAELARGMGVERVVFDRGGYLYHGRVKALAEGAREGGLQF